MYTMRSVVILLLFAVWQHSCDDCDVCYGLEEEKQNSSEFMIGLLSRHKDKFPD